MKKVFAVAAIAAGLYYYDQNVDPIISRNFNRSVPDKAQTPAAIKADYQRGKAAVEEQTQSFTNLVSKEAEQRYNQMESKASKLSNKIGEKANESKDQVQATWNNLDLRPETPYTKSGNPLRDGVASYLEQINSFGNKISGKAEDVENDIRKETGHQNSWFTFGTSNKKQLEKSYDVNKAKALKQYEIAKNRLDQYKEKFKDMSTLSPEEKKFLQDAQKDFDNSLNQLKGYGQDVIDDLNKNLEESKKSWFSWAGRKHDKLQEEYDQQKAEANKQYEAAKKHLDDLTNRIQKSNPFKSKSEQDKHLEAAKNNLDKSYEHLKQYGSGLIDNLTK